MSSVLLLWNEVTIKSPATVWGGRCGRDHPLTRHEHWVSEAELLLRAKSPLLWP